MTVRWNHGLSNSGDVKYKYPPEQAKAAIDTVIKQAELMSANIDPINYSNYTYKSEATSEVLMVAEDSNYEY